MFNQRKIGQTQITANIRQVKNFTSRTDSTNNSNCTKFSGLLLFNHYWLLFSKPEINNLELLTTITINGIKQRKN